MLKVKDSGQFKKDYKKCYKRGLDMNLLKSVVAVLAVPSVLPQNNQDHNLKGNYVSHIANRQSRQKYNFWRLKYI
ncbi:MAG: type II toxin-antitoxin system YafQ family toxin [Lachnospiraceae bacterium]|nr:type II toxin-antitoxin system YafQ family toxin [Lachnospiraceae bacterium]MDE7418474.1 type II toxin-antitoxin system YafQ family toxin [Lachnospiraceae bacterium]